MNSYEDNKYVNKISVSKQLGKNKSPQHITCAGKHDKAKYEHDYGGTGKCGCFFFF